MKNQSTEVCQRWKQSCRTLRIIEVAGLILIAVILILGMIFDLRKTYQLIYSAGEMWDRLRLI